MQNSESSVYLNPEVFQWPCDWESWTHDVDSRIKRSYDTLEYAMSLVVGRVSEFQLADAVMNLKRAINVRLKLLDELYEFSSAASLKGLGALERLEAVGLAKPFLIKQLFDLRNDIEHNDASPPVLERVRELLDVTWYFLRSTDSAVTDHSRTLMFRGPNNNDDDENDVWLRVDDFSGRSSEIKVSGWLAPPALSCQEGWKILVERIGGPPISPNEKGLVYFNAHGKRHPDQRHFIGVIDGGSELLILLWKRMFSLP